MSVKEPTSPYFNDRRIVLRNTSRWIAVGLYLILAAVGAFSAAVSAHVVSSSLYALVAAALLTLAIRAARSAVWVSRDGVTAKADRFTRHLAWTEIERFELGPKRFGLVSGRGLGAWRHDGKWVRLMDYGMDPKNRYQAALDDLKTELARRQGLPDWGIRGTVIPSVCVPGNFWRNSAVPEFGAWSVAASSDP